MIYRLAPGRSRVNSATWSATSSAAPSALLWQLDLQTAPLGGRVRARAGIGAAAAAAVLDALRGTVAKAHRRRAAVID